MNNKCAKRELGDDDLQIANNHIYKRFVYPRPRGICTECKGGIVLRMGTVRIVHWAHLNNDNCQSGGGGETETHKLAKTMLCQYLNDGKMFSYTSVCSNCNQTVVRNIPFTVRSARAECIDHSRLNPADKCIWDIACFDRANRIVFGIEIFHTHKTVNTQARRHIPWIEIDAVAAIQMVTDVTTVSGAFTLANLRPITKCYSDACFSLKELAIGLMYGQEVMGYSCESRKMVDVAIRGKYRKDKFEYFTVGWTLDSNSDRPSTRLWYIFLGRKQCLRCAKRYEAVSFGRPYCRKCWKSVKKTECIDEDGMEVFEDEGDYETVTIDEKNDMLLRFGWLRSVPGDWTPQSPCYFCNTVYDNRVDERANYNRWWDSGANYGRVWWFGDKKRCCTACLEKTYQEQKKSIHMQKILE